MKSRKENDMDWQNEADNGLNTSEWFGAIIRFFLHLGKRDFRTFYNTKELKKNALIGWVFKLVLLGLVVLMTYLYIAN